MDGERVKIGVVGVDSAHLMIVDPAYVGEEWGFRAYDVANNPKQAGDDGLAVMFLAGLGDGAYGVYATYKDYGPGWGRRIAKVEIILTDEDDIDEDEDA